MPRDATVTQNDAAKRRKLNRRAGMTQVTQTRTGACVRARVRVPIYEPVAHTHMRYEYRRSVTYVISRKALAKREMYLSFCVILRHARPSTRVRCERRLTIYSAMCGLARTGNHGADWRGSEAA